MTIEIRSLPAFANRVLREDNPEKKVEIAHEMKRLWATGGLSERHCGQPVHLSDIPGRPQKPDLISPSQLKRRRVGSIAGRVSLLHAIAHIEFNAINLAADMLARFSSDPRLGDAERAAFITDWVGVCDDEARHFMMVGNRLRDYESAYGAQPAHDGLWEAALSTKNDLAARLVIAPMVLEARGLDVTPKMIENLISVGDRESADILTTIYNEEIGHVAAGTRWFKYICDAENRNPAAYFQALLDTHFSGSLKPPFNVNARNLAGMPQSYYQPDLAVN